MAKSEKGKEIYKLYRKLDGLRSNARHLKCNLIDCKETAKGFKFSPYSFYDYSPRAEYWEEESDLTSVQKSYAYAFFFREALKVTEKEIRTVKNKIKELQRSYSIKEIGNERV